MHRQKNTHLRLSTRFLACLGWWFLFASVAPAQPAGPATPGSSSAEQVVVEAGDLRLVLEKTPQGLRVRSLADTAAGQKLLAEEPLGLFSVTVRETGTKKLHTLTADSGWQQVDVSGEAAGDRKLTFAAPVDDRLKGIRIEVTLAAQKPESAITWDLRIAADNPQWALWRVTFPQVAIKDLGEGGRVFVPVTAGIEQADLWSKGGRKGGTYPSGWTCMQYLAAYNRATRTGLYLGVHDPFGSTKDIVAEGQPAKQAVTLRFDHPVPNMGKAGAGFELPGAARWQLLRGDWFDAARIYRAWVSREAKWWPALGRDGREDTPKWMRELPAWALTGGPASECVPRVKALARTLGLPVGFHWYNWHQIPFDNDYPHYFPAKEGFAEGVAELKKAGVYPMPYINGRLWDTRDKGAEDWQFTQRALPAASKDEQGQPYTETYGSKETDGNSVRLAAMCPATTLWQNEVREIVLRLFQECGVSGVYIDQIAAAQPRLCFDASHGHDLGGGHWWTEGYWTMLDAMRSAKPADAMLTTECNAEPYIKWFDGYLTWHWQEQNMVPAFSAVYGGAIQMFGRAYRGGPTQDLAHRMKAGQQLVFGEQIGWFGPEIIDRPNSGAFLRECIQLRWQLKEYFYRGQMARPPRFVEQIPTVTADWQWRGEWPITAEAVMTGAWQIPKDNKVVLLFANVSDQPFAARLEFDPKEYSLSGTPLTAVALRPNGTKDTLKIQAGQQPQVELAARSVVAWEITPSAAPPKARTDLPASSAPALEAATRALSEGRQENARTQFEAVAQDLSAPPFVRGLALLSLAETALAGRDMAAAKTAWERLAADTALPPLYRDNARRRMEEAERRQQGLSARDAAAYRAPLPTLPAPAVTFHLAPAGQDTADGSADSPFRTLEKARDAVRALKKSRGGTLPPGGVKVMIAGGSYAVERPWTLTAEDSGTAEAPVVYQARAGQTPIFRGGTRITGWKPLAEAGVRDRLDPSVRGRVLEADLKALGVTNWGDATALRSRPELFVNGEPQTLARWPNEGFVKTGEILGQERFKVWNTIEGCRDGKFHYVEDRPSRWVEEPDVRLYGYWFWDWFEEYQTVAAIDADAKTFTLSQPYSRYGYRKNQRYYAVNVLGEIDAPGEWYLDRRTDRIYWLPPAGLEWSKAETILSVLDQPFITLDEVEHVILLGLTLQEGRGDGIRLRGGADCLVAGGTIRQCGGDAIVVEGGQRHGIFGCTMHTLGCGGARVAGGERRTLSPGRHFVENCTVFDISRLKRTYTPAVHLDGCGNRIAHNLFERMPSSALRIEGNDHLIELNAIRNVVQESDDQGGLDMFGNPLYRGVVIRWNRWSDIRGGTHNGAAGVRLDDMISGVAVHGNIFERCGAVAFGGVQIHGGKENLVDGNLFLDCQAGISFSRWGAKRWLESISRFFAQAGQEPYASRYPALAGLRTEADLNLVSRNLFVRCPSVFLRDGGTQQAALNATTAQSFDLQAVSQHERVRNDPRLRPLLFDPIPLEEMGPYAHPWQARP
ncbi:MAG: hypothetical protein FJ280_10235 [Planctomycetes bacterium]|nr:hypothetical protein [Planctomycetota bacterium]